MPATQASVYIIGNVAHDQSLISRQRKSLLYNGTVFVLLFLAFMAVMLLGPGYKVVDGGKVIVEPYMYLNNYIDMWWCGLILIVGVVLVLTGIAGMLVVKRFRHGAWYTGAGTVLVVMTLFWVIGYNDACYYPSLIDPASSLTIRNSSSSEFTLTVMSWVSLAAPFVLGYIAYVWFKMDRKPLTPHEVETDHAY